MSTTNKSFKLRPSFSFANSDKDEQPEVSTFQFDIQSEVSPVNKAKKPGLLPALKLSDWSVEEETPASTVSSFLDKPRGLPLAVKPGQQGPETSAPQSGQVPEANKNSLSPSVLSPGDTGRTRQHPNLASEVAPSNAAHISPVNNEIPKAEAPVGITSSLKKLFFKPFASTAPQFSGFSKLKPPAIGAPPSLKVSLARAVVQSPPDSAEAVAVSHPSPLAATAATPAARPANARSSFRLAQRSAANSSEPEPMDLDSALPVPAPALVQDEVNFEEETCKHEEHVITATKLSNKLKDMTHLLTELDDRLQDLFARQYSLNASILLMNNPIIREKFAAAKHPCEE